MLCPKIKKCIEYKTKRKYSFTEKFKCKYKEYWSDCHIYFRKIQRRLNNVEMEK